jgi:amino acid transporter
MTATSKSAVFKRDLSPMSVWALAFGCIIGWGAFMMPGTTFLPTAGTLGTTIAMIIGAVIMVVIAFSYSYMVAIHPKAGGELNYARECFGDNHAYFCGWFLALAYLANVPMNCTALGLMTRKLFFGVFQFGRLYQVAGYDIWLGEVLLSLFVLGIISWLSIRGIRKSGVVQTVMAISLGTAFLIITISALFSPITHWSNLAPFWGLCADVGGICSKSAMNGILAIVAVAPWAYVGFETIPQAAEEFNFSIGRVNMIMIVAIAFGCIVYSCNNLVTAAASPEWTEFIKRHDWAVGAAVEALMGKPGLVVLGIAIASAILTGILGFLTATSRLLYSMARDGYIPSMFAKLHPQYGTPAPAIAFCLVVSAVGPWLGRTALGWFVDMSAIGAAIGFGYATASCFVTIRRRRAQGLEDRPRMALRMSALLGTAFSLGFVALLLIPGMPGCLNIQSYVMLVVWMVLGALFFVLRSKKRVG